MSLLTLERSSPSPHESENDAEEVLSCSSYEGFVAREHIAMFLPPRPWTSLSGCQGEQLRIFGHLKKLMKLMRPADTLRLAVELENVFPRCVTKYLVIVSTPGNQETEETIVLGTEQDASTIRICLVLPLWRDTEIKLDGDGGFSVHTEDRHHVFKPLSVQSMWTTLQALYKATEHARLHNYYVGGLSHAWMTYYTSKVTDDYLILNEWNIMEDVESFRPDSPIYRASMTDTETNGSEDRKAFERLLVCKLREVMTHVDLEEISSKQLRLRLQEDVGMELKEYRGFLDKHMLRILGQMERPSQIFDYLYLGTEWNASNLEELKELKIGYILNISREIDNFYPEVFKYYNVRLYDLPRSELMKYWEKTYHFIKEAKTKGTKVLVHCKMGISRSAATVVAFAMKEYEMAFQEALDHVKQRRSCVNPNDGFMAQLRDYQGILRARHNDLWGKQAPSRLVSSKRRSMSDPNLLRHYDEGAGQGDFEPELSFLVDETEPSSPASPTKKQPAWSSTTLPTYTSTPSHSTTAPIPTSSLSLNHTTPIDKEESIRSYLASLPLIDDDQGIADTVCTTSESGSGSSSPILTPPEDDQCVLYRIAKHIHEQKQRLMSEETSSSSSTTDVEVMENGVDERESQGQPHRIASGGAEETDGVKTTGQVEGQCNGKAGSSDAAILGHAVSLPAFPLPPSVPTFPGIPPKPLHPEVQASLLSSGVLNLAAQAYSIVPPETRRLLEATATTSVTGSTGVPVATQAQPSSTMSLPRPPQPQLRGREVARLRPSPPPLLSSVGLAPAQPATLPHSFIPPLPSSAKKATVSPNSSRSSLSSLSRQSSGALALEGGDSRSVSRTDTASPPLDEGRGLVVERPDFGDSKSDSPLASPSCLDHQHRRTKSANCDLSEPIVIKTAQIYSVPERVKEIEEMNTPAVSAAPDQHSNTSEDGHRVEFSPPAQPTLDAVQDGSSIEFSVGASSSLSPPPVEVTPSADSLSRSSSEGSIPFREASLSDKEEEPLRLLPKFSSSCRGVTRHSSLSPSPKHPRSTGRSLTPHLPLQFSLPPGDVGAPGDINTLLPGDTTVLSPSQDEDMTPALQGGVKARVQDIEERSKEPSPEQQVGKPLRNSLVVAERSGPSAFRRPSLPCNVVWGSGSSSMAVTKAANSSTGSSVEKLSPTELTFQLPHRTTSYDVIAVSDVVTVSQSGSGAEPSPSTTAEDRGIDMFLKSRFKSSSGKFKSEADIPMKLVPVHELKRVFETDQKMEDAKRQRPRSSISSVTIRRAHSLRGIDSARRRYSSYMARSKIMIRQLESHRSTSVSPPQPAYITTLPSVASTQEVDDFETTREKFSQLEAPNVGES